MTRAQAGVARVERSLASLRFVARLMLLIGAASLLAAAILAFAFLAGTIDFVVRAPMPLRLIVWLVAVGAAIELFRRWVVPAILFRPPLTEVALRLERSFPGLAGMLASAIDLARERDGSPVARWLSEQVVARGERAFTNVRLWGSLSWSPLARRIGILLIPLAAIAAGWWLAPDLTAIGARRVFTPWAAVEWPKRTGVEDATTIAVHPLGREIEFRAAVTRTDRALGQTRVAVRYRLIAGEQRGDLQRAILTGQERTIESHDPSAPFRGELYARLVDPAVAGRGADLAVEYWFETQDDRTEERRITLVEAPRVRGMRAAITPPAYADAIADAGLFLRGEADLGAGDDARAVVGPILAGSRIELRIDLNKPVTTPTTESLAEFLPEVAASPGRFETSFQPEAWTLAFAPEEPMRLAIQLRDEHGLAAEAEAVAGFEVVRDRPASAVVSEPPEDEFVLPTAAIPLTGEGRDDLGLALVALDAQVARPPAGSMGAPAEADGPLTTLAGVDAAGARAQSATHLLDLSPLSLSPGDEVWIHALAQDAFADADGPREPSRSPRRRLRVISPEQLIEQVQGELSMIRQSAMRADEAQASIEARTVRGAPDEQASREQAGLTDRLSAQARALERLRQRAERNNLADPMIEELLEDARDAMAQAGDASGRAAQAMQRPPTEPDAQAQARAEAQSAQAEVRSELARLIEMLDRGQDSWAVRREIQRLLDEQQQLSRQTQRAAEELAGRTTDELTDQQRDALDELARRQQELADRTGQAIAELRQRAQQLRQPDPAQAAGLEQAAQRGERAQVEEQMEQAAQNIDQNQASNAGERQQQAEQALEEMLEDIDAQARNRDEALRRIIASLLESLDALIAEQEDRLADLAAARADADFSGLDQGMVRLNQNTMGLFLSARTNMREMDALARLIEEAASAQGEAVLALRADPADPDAAEAAETESLTRLRQARAEARRLEQEAAQRDADRIRRELRRRYRDVLEQQVSLREDTRPFAGLDLDRRQRREVSRLGERQRSLREQLDAVRRETAEIADARIFSLAHDRLDALADAASKALTSGRADDAVIRRMNSSIAILQGLVEALSDENQQDEFRDQEQGEEAGGEGEGGQGQGQGESEDPLLPPIAELRLLKALQVEAMELTRALHELDQADAAELGSLGELQRELYERGKTLIESLEAPPTEPGT